jgi:hypothetical protein
MNRIAAIIGSVPSRGFDGWTKQETGKPPAMNRVAALLARSGNLQNVVRKGYRMNQDFVSTADAANARGGQPQNRVAYPIRDMAKNDPGKPFIINEKRTKFPPGLYKITPGMVTLKDGSKAPKVKAVQLFRKPKTRPFHWMRNARQMVLRGTDIQVLWDNAIKRLLGR